MTANVDIVATNQSLFNFLSFNIFFLHFSSLELIKHANIMQKRYQIHFWSHSTYVHVSHIVQLWSNLVWNRYTTVINQIPQTALVCQYKILIKNNLQLTHTHLLVPQKKNKTTKKVCRTNLLWLAYDNRFKLWCDTLYDQ